MSNADKYPIKLIEVFFVRSVVISIPGHVPGTVMKVGAPVNNIEVQKFEKDGETLYQGSFRTIINAEQKDTEPYHIDIHAMANFKVDDTLTEAEALRGVTINANSVLFGAIRESVAWLTSRQIYGPVMLGMSVLNSAPPTTDGTTKEAAPTLVKARSK
jgi:preprotein translocase subunit SecB